MIELNEDFVEKPKKKIKPKLNENLEQFYGADNAKPAHSVSASGLTQVGPSFDGYTIEIVQGDKKISLANEKFVTFVKEYMNSTIMEIEKLKRSLREHEREIQSLKSKIDSNQSTLNNKISSLSRGRDNFGFEQ